MSVLTLLAALLPVAAVLLLLEATRWDGSRAPALVAALAVGLGIGVGSVAFFFSLVACNGARAGVLVLDCALLLSAAALRWRAAPAARRRPHATSIPRPARDRALAAAVAAAALAGAAAFGVSTLDSPHGEWDAWAIWNLRARWLFRAGPAWRRAFGAHSVHGDYPLLLPGAVARLWVYSGSDSTGMPAALAAIYAVALVLLLYGALAAIRGRTHGLLGALCLLGTPLFLTNAAWQYADLPLAYYLLAALALLALRDHDPACRPTALAWAGVAAGLAAWTKNEGLLFVLCLAAVRTAPAVASRRWARAPAAWFIAGLLPPAVAVLYFKLTLAPPTYEFAGQHTGDILTRLGEAVRYTAVLRAASAELLHVGGPLWIGLAVYAALLGRTRDRPARRAGRTAALVLGLVALGYGGVYLITPADLAWPLSHSLDRLILQLWPSALFAFFLSAASPAELEVPAAAARRTHSADRPCRRTVGVASPPVGGEIDRAAGRGAALAQERPLADRRPARRRVRSRR